MIAYFLLVLLPGHAVRSIFLQQWLAMKPQFHFYHNLFIELWVVLIRIGTRLDSFQRKTCET